MKKSTKIMVSALALSCICSLFAATSVSAKEYYGNDDKGYQWTYDDTTNTITYRTGHYDGEETDIFDIFSSIKNLVLADDITAFGDFNYFPELESVTIGKGISFNEGYTLNLPYSAEEFIVPSDHPTLAVYDGAVYSKNYQVLYCCPALKNTLRIHPNCRVFASSRSVAKAFEVDASNQYFSVYDGALYSKDYSELIVAPQEKDTLTLHPNVKEVDLSHRPLQAYRISSTNGNFSVYDGMLYSEDFTQLIACPSEKNSFAFHPDLDTVCSNTFETMSFGTIVFPEGTTTLQAYSFNTCEGNVVVPDTLVNFESDRYGDWNAYGRCILLCSSRNTAASELGTVLSDAEFNRYYSTGGTADSGWVQNGDDWYYYSPETGEMLTGFQRIDGKAYYFGANGAREHDKWKKVGNDWYYLNSYGAGAVKCWLLSGGKWYFMQADGSMARSQWIKWYNKWYYVGSDGAMYANRWIKSSGKWYYVDSTGLMSTNRWIKSSGRWYYLGSDGAMYENKWVYSSNKWYYLGADGAMYANRYTPDGYWVNSSGVWVK